VDTFLEGSNYHVHQQRTKYGLKMTSMSMEGYPHPQYDHPEIRLWRNRHGCDRKFRQLLVAVLVPGTDAGALAGGVSPGRGTLLALLVVCGLTPAMDTV